MCVHGWLRMDEYVCVDVCVYVFVPVRVCVKIRVHIHLDAHVCVLVLITVHAVTHVNTCTRGIGVFVLKVVLRLVPSPSAFVLVTQLFMSRLMTTLSSQ